MSNQKTVFAMIDRVAKIMILHDKNIAKSFEPETALTIKCQQVIPLTAVGVHAILDMDNFKKRCFYFSITDVPGNMKPCYIFGCQTAVERDKWVDRIYYISNLGVNLDALQCDNEALHQKLFSATTLLKMNVGEKLLENMLSGKYRVGSRRYKEVKEHLDDYFTIWSNVMEKKTEMHKELLCRNIDAGDEGESDMENADDERTRRNLLLKKVIATIDHVRKESVLSAHGSAFFK